MGVRKIILEKNEVYHILTRTIAGFEILNNKKNCSRFLKTLKYYNNSRTIMRFSLFTELPPRKQAILSESAPSEQLVQIIAYCLMPTHIHLVLKQLKEDSIVVFMKNALNSFTRYFNSKNKRRGPLWESRFKNVLVDDDEQLLHLTRYVHLNPVSAGLALKPEDWKYSSYNEYLGKLDVADCLCGWKDLIDIRKCQYKKFVDDRISYQKELSKIKKVLIEDYAG